MKKLLIFLFWFRVIVSISEVSSSEQTSCKDVDQECEYDVECCLEKCNFSFWSLRRYCSFRSSHLDILLSVFKPSKDYNGMCSYHVPKNKSTSKLKYQEYGINAAHNILPANSKVEVSYNDKTVMVTINDLAPQTAGAILELSKEAANVLDIFHDSTFSCKVVIPMIQNNTVLRIIKQLLPYMCLMFVLHLA